MAYYFTRHDAMDQATTTYGVVETGSDGSTAGPIKAPTTTSRIKSIRVTAVINGAWTTITGFIVVLKVSPVGAQEQELVVYGGHLEDGGGTLTYTTEKPAPLLVLPVDIPIIGGNDVKLAAAYYAADPGTIQLSVTVEVV